MSETTVAQRVAAWSDVGSLLLLSLCIVIGGIDPVMTIWGRSLLHNILLAICMSLSAIYSIGRLIYEGYTVETGPREFLAVSVVYTARWMWLFSGVVRPNARGSKIMRVCRELRHLQSVRLGTSTNASRYGSSEIVLRRGVRHVHASPKEIYWRGIERYCKLHPTIEVWEVQLEEAQFHSSLLDVMGTTEYRRADNLDETFKVFYDVVMTCDSQNPQLRVDYQPFLDQFDPVIVTRQAQRVGATDTSPLGGIARRVAADAMYFISKKDGECRTRKHVEVINMCLEKAVRTYVEVGESNNV